MTSKDFIDLLISQYNEKKATQKEKECYENLLKVKQDLEVLEIFKTIAKRKGAISTALYIEDNRPKTNIIIKLDTANDKEILCNEKIKQWLEGETK